MEELEIAPFTGRQRIFLKEYIVVLEPIATALNNLQGNKCPYGIVLPTLYKTHAQLETIERNNDLKTCKPLLKAVKNSFEERLNPIMNWKSSKAAPALIATVCHPYFKLLWLSPEKKTPEAVKEIIDIVVKAADEISIEDHLHENKQRPESSSTTNRQQPHATASEAGSELQSHFVYDLFFDNQNEIEDSVTHSSDDHTKNYLEISKYLEYPAERKIENLDQLSQFPMVRKLFKKFNVIMPSEADVERTFSYGGMILRPHRRNMLPTIFEKTIVLLSNYFQDPELREIVDSVLQCLKNPS